MAVGLWGIQPDAFWKMTMPEWWLIYDTKIGGTKYGGLTGKQAERLYGMLD